MEKYFKFDGTATRSEYWAMQLLAGLALFMGFVLMLSEVIILGFPLFFAACWYNLATTVRRIRDSGNNVWWIIVYAVPYISFIAMVVFGILETKKVD